MTMLAALFALAAGAAAGIFLAVRHFMHKRLPAMVALLHGLGGATGFTLVLITVVLEPDFRPIRDVLYLLIATVVLGVVNLLFHIRKVRHRTSLILLHGLTAVTAASFLIRALVVHPPPQAPSAPPPTPPPPEASAVAAAPSTHAPQELSATAPAAKPAAETFAVADAVQRALESPIQFETNSAIVSQGSTSALAEIASALKAHPDIALIQVQGHADERGDHSRNVALTRARAAAVVTALVANGVERKRLHSAGYGSQCPKDESCQQSSAPESCHTAESWERDRRVVFRVLEVGKTSFRGEVVCARGAELIPAEDRRFHAAE